MPFIADNPVQAPAARRVTLILDASGSMGHVRDITIETLNAYVAKLIEEPGVTLITAWKFDSDLTRKPRIVKLYADLPADLAAGHITAENYDPTRGGGTPLYDAIGIVCNGITDGVKTLVVILTDGQENSSVEYKIADVQALIRDREAKDWTFVFLAADISKFNADSMSGKMGMSVNNVMSYGKGATASMGENLAAATRRFTVAGSSGTREFFQESEREIKDKKTP